MGNRAPRSPLTDETRSGGGSPSDNPWIEDQRRRVGGASGDEASATACHGQAIPLPAPAKGCVAAADVAAASATGRHGTRTLPVPPATRRPQLAQLSHRTTSTQRSGLVVAAPFAST